MSASAAPPREVSGELGLCCSAFSHSAATAPLCTYLFGINVYSGAGPAMPARFCFLRTAQFPLVGRSISRWPLRQCGKGLF